MIKDLARRVAAVRGKYDHVCAAVTDEREALRKAERTVSDLMEVHDFYRSIAQGLQQRAHKKITRIVTKCLRGIFGDDAYAFKIHFEQKRNRTEARAVLIRGDKEYTPLRSVGGGVVQITAFALRLAFLVLSQPKLRPVLFLDEPFNAVSKAYRSRIRELLETLSDELGVQFIIVTHIDELETGQIVELS